MRILPSNLALFSGPVGDQDAYAPVYTDVYAGADKVFTNISEEVLVITGYTPYSRMRELYGIQSISFSNSMDLIETDVYGQSEKLLEYPGFNEQKVELSYYCDGFSNEVSLGLMTGSASGAFSNIDLNQETNLYLFVGPQGLDAKGLQGGDGKVIAMGNGFLTSYSVEAAIGSYATASASFDFLNSVSHADGYELQNPSIVSGVPFTGVVTMPRISGSVGRPGIVRPGEIQVSINDGVFQSADSLIQSFKLDFSFEKENIPIAGQRYPRRISASAPKTDLSIDILSSRDFVTGSVYSYLCRTGSNDITVTFRRRCSSTFLDFIAQYRLSGMMYNGESFSSRGREGQVTTMSWRGQTGISLHTIEYFYVSPGGDYYLSPGGKYYTHFK